MQPTWLEESIIFECLSGSHAYGLNTPDSDEDYRGVCVPPVGYFLGLYRFDQAESKTPDRTIFNIVKFVHLAVRNNPNILELLFMPDDVVLDTSPEWEELRAIRNLFLSKKCKHTYSGYAFSQIKRVRTHRAWLLNPPEKKPERKDFGLLEHTKLSSEVIGAIDKLLSDVEEHGGVTAEKDMLDATGFLMRTYQNEKAYRTAIAHYKQYQNWKEQRNPARAELETKYGYDTKHMSHVFRLLIQGQGILQEHDLRVRLLPEHRDLCMGIRNGKYSYEELDERMQELEAGFVTLCETSTLRKSPDVNAINDVLVSIVARWLRDRGMV